MESSLLTGDLFTSAMPESACIGAAAIRVAEADDAAVRRAVVMKEKRMMAVEEGIKS